MDVMSYLTSIGGILDVGNVIFFIANFPQMVTAYKHRTNLSGLSGMMLALYMIATVFFGMVAYLTGGHLATALCITNEFFYTCQLYWKHKYRKKIYAGFDMGLIEE